MNLRVLLITNKRLNEYKNNCENLSNSFILHYYYYRVEAYSKSYSPACRLVNYFGSIVRKTVDKQRKRQNYISARNYYYLSLITFNEKFRNSCVSVLATRTVHPDSYIDMGNDCIDVISLNICCNVQNESIVLIILYRLPPYVYSVALDLFYTFFLTKI